MEFSLPQSETTQQEGIFSLDRSAAQPAGSDPWVHTAPAPGKPRESIPAPVWGNTCVLWALHTAWHPHPMAFAGYAEGKKGLKPAEWDVALF